MRIATFNLESLDEGTGVLPPLDQRIKILRPQLLRMNADIICLQEVNGQRRPGEKERVLLALDHLLDGTDYEYYFRKSTTGSSRSGVADVHNLVTLSRFPIVNHEEVRHQLVEPVTCRHATAVPKDNTRHPVTWDRPFLVTQHELAENRILTLINLHFRAPLASPIVGQKQAPFIWKSVAGWAEGYFLSSMKRAGQALELRMKLDELLQENPDRLLLVCGDFNAEDHETALRLVIGSEEDTGNGALAEHMMIPLDRSVASDRRFSIRHHGRSQLPDHILVNRPLMGRFRKLEIHNEILGDEVIGYSKISHAPDSFHAPLVAEFDM